MSDNIRHLIGFAAVLVIVGVPLYHVLRMRRPGLVPFVTVLGAVLVAWVSFSVPPFTTEQAGGDWALPNLASPAVFAACLGYLVIAVLSNRYLIAMPLYRQLEARADEVTSLLDEGNDDPKDSKRLAEKIDIAKRRAARRLDETIVWVPVADVLAANRAVDGIERQVLSAVSDEKLRVGASQITALLPTTKSAQELSVGIAAAIESADQAARAGTAAPADVNKIRTATAAALSYIQLRRREPQERDGEQTRIALWLTMVGLTALYILAFTFPGREPLLVAGALGGLLGVVAALVTDRTQSLGMVILSPVAGALNAAGGIVLIEFLAQGTLLAEQLAGLWEPPFTGDKLAMGLAAALLLGFSGGLFSRLAVASTTTLFSKLDEEKNDAPVETVSVTSPAPAAAGDAVATAGTAASNGQRSAGATADSNLGLEMRERVTHWKLHRRPTDS